MLLMHVCFANAAVELRCCAARFSITAHPDSPARNTQPSSSDEDSLENREAGQLTFTFPKALLKSVGLRCNPSTPGGAPIPAALPWIDRKLMVSLDGK